MDDAARIPHETDNRSAAAQLTPIAGARSAPAAIGLVVPSEPLKNPAQGLSEISPDAFAAARGGVGGKDAGLNAL